MPSITMELVKMSKEKKAQLVKEVTEATARATGIAPQAIFVFNDYPHVVRLYVLDLKSVL